MLQEREMNQDESEAQSRRRFKRKYSLFKIPVYDAETKRFLGLVQDLSENGIQLLGINIDVNSTKMLIIHANDYVKGAPISFEAVCRWVRKEDPQGYYISGFEITHMPEETRRNLISLMEYVTLE
jgi:hypothetical protein